MFPFKQYKHPLVKCPRPGCGTWAIFGWNGVLNCKNCNFPLNPLYTKFAVVVAPKIVVWIGIGLMLYWVYILSDAAFKNSEIFWPGYFLILFTYAVTFGLGVRSALLNAEVWRSFSNAENRLDSAYQQATYTQRRHVERYSPRRILSKMRGLKPVIIEYSSTNHLRKTKTFSVVDEAIRFIEDQKIGWWDWEKVSQEIPEPSVDFFNEFGGEADTTPNN